MGAVTQHGYDAEGGAHVGDGCPGNVTQYAYDLSGSLASVTDANNHVTSYTYDGVNRKVSRVLPLGQTETFAYDMAGNEISHVDFRGKTSTYNFDVRDRLADKGPGCEPWRAYGDVHIQPDGTRGDDGRCQWVDDVRLRHPRSAADEGDTGGDVDLHTYDPAGNVASIRSSNVRTGRRVNYAWDLANQLGVGHGQPGRR